MIEFKSDGENPVQLANCPVCENPFKLGEAVTRHYNVPVDSIEGLKAGMGEPYAGKVAMIHQWCADLLDGKA